MSLLYIMLRWTIGLWYYAVSTRSANLVGTVPYGATSSNITWKYTISFSMAILLLVVVFSPWASFGQEPEPSQATGMALVRCILGKFLGVVCHCFPPDGHIWMKK
jgi:hypothetical protein